MEQIKYLTHFTDIENLSKILKSGYLYTAIERNKLNIKYVGTASLATNTYKEADFSDEFPGIFLSFISQTEFGKKVRYWNKIMLVFSNKLLKQKNYHANIIDNNGLISEDITYFPHNIKDLPKLNDVEEYYNKHYNSYPGTEIVFHDKININLVCEIWCNSKDTYEEVINNVPRNIKHLIKIKNKYTNIVCNVDEKYLDLSSMPYFLNLDYHSSGFHKLIYPYKTKTKSSMKHYKKMLKLANLDDSLINKLNTPELIDKYFIKNKLYSFYHNNRDKQNLEVFSDDFYN